jgi:peptidoglycan/LPS O-acetylase OafA/YrhL
MATRHFRTLDALRGVAALAVVFYHLPVGGLAPKGYLAVDLFFLMSGFVVANAYETRLRADWNPGGFLIARVKRLWPLYALGIFFGAFCYQIAESVGPANGIHVPHLPTLSVVVLNLLFLPWNGMAKWPSFPFNSPSWSLSVEMIGNLVYGVAARTLSDDTLKILSLVGAGGLCLIVYRAHSLDCGVDADNAFGGFVRFAFSFPLGVLLYRQHRDGRLQRIAIAWPFVLLTAAAVFAGIMPFGGAGDLVATLFVFPLLLVAALSQEPKAQTAATFAWAGALSYPLYIIHHPILDLMKALRPGPILWWMAVPLVVVAAVLLERLFDAPLQRRLAAGFRQNRASA